MGPDFEILTNEYPVRAEMKVLPAISLCLQRGGVAPIQSVSITNDSDAPLEDLDIEIRTAPEFMLPLSLRLRLTKTATSFWSPSTTMTNSTVLPMLSRTPLWVK